VVIEMKRRLKRLEALEGELIGVLTLPSGERVRYRRGSAHDGGDLFEAFLACMNSEEHWLLPYIRQMNTKEGLPGLIQALESSRERVRVEGDAE
jgi:hypothetical protein